LSTVPETLALRLKGRGGGKEKKEGKEKKGPRFRCYRLALHRRHRKNRKEREGKREGNVSNPPEKNVVEKKLGERGKRKPKITAR